VALAPSDLGRTLRSAGRIEKMAATLASMVAARMAAGAGERVPAAPRRLPRKGAAGFFRSTVGAGVCFAYKAAACARGQSSACVGSREPVGDEGAQAGHVRGR
jgi:hypothetical protein